jgi:hypothetical protein
MQSSTESIGVGWPPNGRACTQLRFANLQIRESPDEVAGALTPVIERLRQQG